MQRRFSTIAACAVALSVLAQAPTPASANGLHQSVEQGQALPSVLNQHVVLSADVVRLGDLFANAGKSAEVAIAYAPEPGKRKVMDARWLYRVASAYGLNWHPRDGAVQAVIERSSIMIPRAEIKDELLFALADHGLHGEMDLEITNRFHAVHLSAEADPTITVESLDFRHRTGRFTAMVKLGSGIDERRLRLTGRAFETLEIPVLSTRVLRGDVIRKEHISWVKTKADRLQDDVLLDAEDIIGMTPRRAVRPGAPIPSSDLSRPMIVEKNSLVTIFHQVLNMTLSAQGKALESGANGDIVRVRNERSNQVIEAEVVGAGRVAVRLLPQNALVSLN